MCSIICALIIVSIACTCSNSILSISIIFQIQAFEPVKYCTPFHLHTYTNTRTFGTIRQCLLKIQLRPFNSKSSNFVPNLLQNQVFASMADGNNNIMYWATYLHCVHHAHIHSYTHSPSWLCWRCGVRSSMCLGRHPLLHRRAE